MTRNEATSKLSGHKKIAWVDSTKKTKTISIASAAWSATNWNSKKNSRFRPFIIMNPLGKVNWCRSIIYIGKKETFHFPVAEKERKIIVTIASDFCKSLFFWCKSLHFRRLLGIYETTIVDLPKEKSSNWSDRMKIYDSNIFREH